MPEQLQAQKRNNMESITVISAAVRGPSCHLKKEGCYVLVTCNKNVRRSHRKRGRVVSLEDASYGLLPVSRARLGKGGSEAE